MNCKLNAVVQIFVKAPIPGKVKTRLAKDIGDELAARFALEQFKFLLKELSADYAIQCWVEGDMSHPAFAVCDELSIKCFQQQGLDLGEKMQFAIAQGLAVADKVMLVGSDCSGLRLDILRQAESLLNSHHMVFVPAEDGGFVLWGCQSNQFNNIFSDVVWGEEHVWEKTLSNATINKIDVGVLSRCWDVDTLDDVRKYQNKLPHNLQTFITEHGLISS